MMTTDKDSCNIIVALLQKHGVKDVVVSPGSRNAPLVVALARTESIRKTVIVDERCAAFVALGMCAAKNGETAVAIVCTSGTAMLNYAPAIAEAYYRHLPLIVISADRPMEWIDQDDSQTLRQYEALSNYVKKSYNIPTRCDEDNVKWYVNRMVNDAIITAITGRRSPVHINVQLDEPLNSFKELTSAEHRVITAPDITHKLSDCFIKELISKLLIAKKVLIVAGFQNEPDNNWVNKAHLNTITSTLNNVAILTESIANINCGKAIGNIDRTLSVMTDADRAKLRPEVVITVGGALISRHIKKYLRENRPQEHWHIGVTDTTIDCFQALTMRVEMHPSDFFEQICNTLKTLSCEEIPNEANYAAEWHNLDVRAKASHERYVSKISWSDMKAFSIILPRINGNLHLSNGTPIRYQQLFDYNSGISQVRCNRGVSGIDGSTSTAIGHAIATTGNTILITGDLSAQYDIGALAINGIPARFKMIVMCNGGGGIFRFINSTSGLPELEEYFVTHPRLPLKQLAEGYGFTFYQATDEASLEAVLGEFMSQDKKPAILSVVTPPQESADILKNYFNRDNHI